MDTIDRIKTHSLFIKDVTTVTGIRSVISVEEKEVRLSLENKQLILTGNRFSAEKLSLEEGTLVLSGEVVSIKYVSPVEAKSFIKRMFK